jgi:hypothetical protein
MMVNLILTYHDHVANYDHHDEHIVNDAVVHMHYT